MLLAYDRIKGAKIYRDPYMWWELDGVIRAPWLHTLHLEIPWRYFKETAVHGTDKPYKMHVCSLFSSNEGIAAHLAGSVWDLLTSELAGARYRAAMTALTGVDVQTCCLEINAWTYDHGCFLAPHTDKENKLLTHLFYLVPKWEPSWGGRLLILRSASLDDFAYAVAPATERSVILPRSASSWHAVEQVQAQAPFPRCSLQVVFLK